MLKINDLSAFEYMLKDIQETCCAQAFTFAKGVNKCIHICSQSLCYSLQVIYYILLMNESKLTRCQLTPWKTNDTKKAVSFKYIWLYFIHVLYSFSLPKSLLYYMTIMAIIYYKRLHK